MNISLIVALIGLIILIGTSLFKSHVTRKYEREKINVGSNESLKKNLKLKEHFDQLSFWVLIIAALLSVYSAFIDKNENDATIKKLTSKINQLEIKIIPYTKKQTSVQDNDLPVIAELQQHNQKMDKALQECARIERMASLENEQYLLTKRVKLLEGKLVNNNRRRIKCHKNQKIKY